VAITPGSERERRTYRFLGPPSEPPKSDNLTDVEISATEAARRFSDILDAVEHRGESFVIVRKGRPVARMGPAVKASGESIKEILRGHRRDPDWETELRELRAMVAVEDRSWSA
jgi:prevent-host-death family protein